MSRTLVLSIVFSSTLGCAEELRSNLTVQTVPGTVDSADSGEGPGDSRDTSGDSGAVDCANAILDATPAASTTARLTTRVQVQLRDPEPAARIGLREEGRAVAGAAAVAFEGGLHTFEPDAPLLAGTAYTTELQWSCGTTRIGWTTEIPVSRLGLGGARVQTPSSRYDLEDAFAPVWVQLQALGAGRIAVLLGAVGESGTQDPCVPTTILTGLVDESGAFDLGVPRTFLGIGGTASPVRDLSFSGEVASASGSFRNVALAARVDTRAIALGIDPTWQAICGDARPGCGGCPDNENACLDVVLDQIPIAVAPAGLVLMPRDADAVANDPACMP